MSQQPRIVAKEHWFYYIHEEKDSSVTSSHPQTRCFLSATEAWLAAIHSCREEKARMDLKWKFGEIHVQQLAGICVLWIPADLNERQGWLVLQNFCWMEVKLRNL